MLKIHPLVLEDHGLDRETNSNPEARDDFAQTVPESALTHLKYGRARPGNWYTLQEAADNGWDKYLGTRAYVLGGLCMTNWITTAEDLFCLSLTTKKFKVTPEKSKREALRKAKTKLEAHRRQAQNNVAACAQLACDSDIRHGFRSILLWTRPVYLFHKDLMLRLKGGEAVAQTLVNWAQWSWMRPLCEIAALSQDKAGLSRCGFRIEFSKAADGKISDRAPEVMHQDSLAKSNVRLQTTLISTHAGSMTYWVHYYLGKLFGSLGPAELVSFTMREFHADCSAFWWAKALPEASLSIVIC